MPVDFERYLMVGAALFVLGAIGFMTRRNLIVMFLSAEMMLHGVSLSLVTFGRLHNTFDGQVFTIFILTVAACEAGIALALILLLWQAKKTLDIQLWTDLREADLPKPPPDEGILEPQEIRDLPRLTPAGAVPHVDSGTERTLYADASSPKHSGQA